VSDTVQHFLAMGGYAVYVWPAYGVATLVLGGMAIWSWRGYRRQQREWEAQAKTRPRRRA
jgi:heme exporter protein D